MRLADVDAAPTNAPASASGGSLFAQDGRLLRKGGEGHVTEPAPARGRTSVQPTLRGTGLEFHDVVTELYFARERIAAPEAENAVLRARLEAAEEQDG